METIPGLRLFLSGIGRTQTEDRSQPHGGGPQKHKRAFCNLNDRRKGRAQHAPGTLLWTAGSLRTLLSDMFVSEATGGLRHL